MRCLFRNGATQKEADKVNKQQTENGRASFGDNDGVNMLVIWHTIGIAAVCVAAVIAIILLFP